MLKDHNEIIRNRYAKADAMRERGLNPYVNRWLPTHRAAELIKDSAQHAEANQKVRVAGRMMSIRVMGKAAFFHVRDESGQIQIYIKKGELPDEQYEQFREFADMGDIVGVEGEVFITRTGELSVLARSFVLLSKSVRPLPEKWHGLKDVETRYRQRYVDLIANTEVRDIFVLRSRIMAGLRAFLISLGYMEVETPMMQPVFGGAAARPFSTHHNALDMPLFLRIAPELYLKRLTVGGMERIFEINRNFRNEGISTRHNPEFTMLELYTAWWDFRDTMDLTERMLRGLAQEVFGRTRFAFGEEAFDFGPGFPRMTYLEALHAHVPEAADRDFKWSDPPETTRTKLEGIAKPAANASTATMLVELFEERVEATLSGPIFITEFPKAVSPLAKSRADDPTIAERFELYICGMEIANGYSELNDPREQYERFREQVEARARGDEEANEMDEDYIRALEYGMPPCSGLGVGIDRLTMLLTNSASIRDVILFPLMKPE